MTETNFDLINLTLELNSALRRVKSLQERINQISAEVVENNLSSKIFNIAKEKKYLEVLNFKFETSNTINNNLQRKFNDKK
ncbi:hypothetical protein ACMC3V_001773 [Campylobacter coli]|uniref:hypothetical protein n=1 Tax=Campylobacter coli TaxID=195 RepID=UPI00069A997A|nr:hypothetical protein [Campylobacter coli]EAH7486153.1 hypothetical protein [Campylobacter jejuni]EAC2043919.1 hypothetical protein [Campylobacter coli]EAH6107321.1 hypothetical protein [Campylobacter coli]EAH6987941.1 hypothetical protein [Campylobacter coli]EAH7272728.1 hypothetical protein [Campylobacter coli]